MEIFSTESRIKCLEERIEGLIALSQHRQGEDRTKDIIFLSSQNCTDQKNTDSLLCKIREIDFWIH